MFRKKFRLSFSRIHLFPTSPSHRPAASIAAMAASESSDPDFHSAVSSPRFFVSSPGTSNSILDSPEPPSSAAVMVRCTIPVRKYSLERCAIPMRKYSLDPYVDFRESMEEMIEARRELFEPKTENGLSYSDEYEYLQDLLLCYLALNPKWTHRFIISAFIDLFLSSSVCCLPETRPIDTGGAAPTTGRTFV